jgi:hypothetical protein
LSINFIVAGFNPSSFQIANRHAILENPGKGSMMPAMFMADWITVESACGFH